MKAIANPNSLALENWVLARCFAKVAAGTPAGEDAVNSAGAYLQEGPPTIEVYERLEGMIDVALAERRTGYVESEYNTTKCIDVFREAVRMVTTRGTAER